MSMNDLLSDMITRVRNGQSAHLAQVTTNYSSKLLKGVLSVLQDEGFIRQYEEVQDSSGKLGLVIALKYFEGKPVIRRIERISKPGRRVYAKRDALPTVDNGLGIVILTTSQGVVPGYKAQHGGELLCKVA